MKNLILITPLIILLGCSSNNASHLPSAFELPGAIISTTIENTHYHGKRKQVFEYVKTHYNTLKNEIRSGQGSHLIKVMQLAGVKQASYPTIQKELQNDYKVMFHNNLLVAEAITSSFTSLYIPDKNSKKMNGFSFTEVYSMVEKYLKNNFEKFRLSLKNNSTTESNKLAALLRITDAKKRKIFLNSFKGKYHKLYLEPVVVGVMVRGSR